MSKIISVMVMSLAVSFNAHASETRQVVYRFAPNWVPYLTHVICDDCPPAQGLRGIPIAFKMNVIKMRAVEPEKTPMKTEHSEDCEGAKGQVQTLSVKEEKKECGKSGKSHMVYFHLDSSAVSPPEKERLLTGARSFAPGGMEVTGYTCDLGSQAYNDGLAIKRAEAVSEILASAGMAREKMRITGKGKCCYAGEGRELDRRVEITVKEDITREKGSIEKTAGRVEDRFPFPDAVKIGNGKNIVVEISDPDCPYCRQASAWLSGRKDITRYVYFLPLNIHPNAEYKAKYILCSNDRAQAYHDVYSGRFDQELPPTSTDCDAEALLRRHTELAAGAGVYGTPVFWVNGERIDGADIELMESLLSGNR